MYKIFVFSILSLFVFLHVNFVLAEPLEQGGPANSNNTITLTNPLGNGVTPQTLIGKIIKGVLGLVGSLALAMFVYGGFTWMLAAGNSTNVEKGKQILIWATIGLIVIFSSYALVQFVFKDVLGVT